MLYHSKEDLLEKVKYYANDDEERNRIALNGFKKVKMLHTYLNRALQLYSIIKENI